MCGPRLAAEAATRVAIKVNDGLAYLTTVARSAWEALRKRMHRSATEFFRVDGGLETYLVIASAPIPGSTPYEATDAYGLVQDTLLGATGPEGRPVSGHHITSSAGWRHTPPVPEWRNLGRSIEATTDRLQAIADECGGAMTETTVDDHKVQDFRIPEQHLERFTQLVLLKNTEDIEDEGGWTVSGLPD